MIRPQNSTLVILTLLKACLYMPLHCGYLVCILFCALYADKLATIKQNNSHSQFVLYQCLSTECVFLAVTAYGFYMVISKSLKLHIIINKALCVQMAAISWILGFFNGMTQNVLTLRVFLHGKNVINHFVCNTDFNKTGLNQCFLE